MEFRDGFWDLRALGRGGVRRHGGFALLIVLWVLVLIAFLTAQVTARGRTELRIATNLLANSIAQAAADGAIYEAIFHLLDPRADERWVLDGNNREIMIGSTRVIVRLEDEAWRINPNLASLDLLEALLRNTGTGADAAHAIAKAITEWVGSSPVTRTKTAMLADYQAAGLDYGPPGAPLETIDELRLVLGLTPEIFGRILPHLTLFGPGSPSKTSADSVVAAALADLLVQERGPTAFDAPPDILVARINAIAYGANHALATRLAVSRVGQLFPQGYQLLAWSNGAVVD